LGRTMRIQDGSSKGKASEMQRSSKPCSRIAFTAKL
jgi:hypothetical protein